MAGFPTINGNRVSWSSIETTVNNKIFREFKDLSFKGALEPGETPSTTAQPGGRTRGKYKPSASFTMLAAEYDELIASLGQGYMEEEFDVIAHIQDTDEAPLREIKVHRARIKSDDESYSDGTDALMVKVELSVMMITKNGLSPIKNLRGVTP